MSYSLVLQTKDFVHDIHNIINSKREEATHFWLNNQAKTVS